MKENADKARSLDTAELTRQVRDSGEQMFRLRFQMSMGQMEGLKKLRVLKRERARMLTVLRERELHREPAAKVHPSAPHVAAPAKPAAKPKAEKAKLKSAAKPVAKKAAPKAAARTKPASTIKPRKSSKG
ncbi:MAG: 50S ribosomal protein L29 [Acidobacteria bacterium]|jgi:large subunit ribosomal protein L29|nr:MAG: 50S ribosomal protein L29 [Acidobacteriota bacterium]